MQFSRRIDVTVSFRDLYPPPRTGKNDPTQPQFFCGDGCLDPRTTLFSPLFPLLLHMLISQEHRRTKASRSSSTANAHVTTTIRLFVQECENPLVC